MLLGMAPDQAEPVRRTVGAPPALHAGRAPGRLRLGDQLPHPPAGGERVDRELPVGGLRARRRQDDVRARGAALPRARSPTSLPRRTRRCGTACRTAAIRTRVLRRADARLRQRARHRPGLPGNRAWGREILARCDHERPRRRPRRGGRDRRTPGTLERLIADARGAASGWAALGAERARVGAARGRARARGSPRATAGSDDGRGGQDARRGRPRGERGDRLRPLLRRERARARHASRAPASSRRG